MTEADLVDDEDRADERDFPTRWHQGDQVLSLTYRFEPGAADDGVSVVVPLALLASLRTDGFDWQVPGLRAELVTALLRALPKVIRRNVVPAADWASKFADDLSGAGPESHNGLPPRTLTEALATLVQRVAGQPVKPSDFELSRVASHLGVSFRVVDERGRSVASGRSLTDLQESLAGRVRTSVARSLQKSAPGPAAVARSTAGNAAPPSAAVQERTGITTWDFGDLPDVVDTKVAGGVVRGYPALIDEGTSVTLRVEATPERAARLTEAGVRRLLLLAVPSPATYVLEHLTSAEKLALASSPYPSAKALIEDTRAAVADAVVARSVLAGEASAVIRSAAQFEHARTAFSAGVVDELFAAVSLVARILTSAREADRGVKAQNSMALLSPLSDVRAQLAGLVYPGFVRETGMTRLAHLPRYLGGVLERLRTMADNPGRDRTRLTEFERSMAAFVEAGGALPLPTGAAPSLVHTRWLLEEYRISLFAQGLGTAESVSPQRILKSLRE